MVDYELTYESEGIDYGTMVLWYYGLSEGVDYDSRCVDYDSRWG